MPVYRRMCHYNICVHLLFLFALQSKTLCTYSILHLSLENINPKLRPIGQLQRVKPGKACTSNTRFTVISMCILAILTLITWLSLLLLCSGDIQPNPGPSSISSISSASNPSNSSNISNDVISSLSINHNLSFVQYNVQSILNKLDILQTELFEFDILAFSETWLNQSISSDDLLFQSFNRPERKDRVEDSHGGVMIYVKEGIYYKRRDDLEIGGIECIWLEVANHNKRILFALFYRPPNLNISYLNDIEDSIALAVDTGISEIIITGDLNLNFLSSPTRRKIEALCTQFMLFQSITQPTHFTETSSSLIDVILVSNKDHLVISGVGEPFLHQELRYHCPVFGILKFSKPKVKAFKRHIWSYDKGNYELLRNKARDTDWDSLRDENIDTYATNISNSILAIASERIPNKSITVKPSDPPWITSGLERQIRKRRRAYRKAKATNQSHHWAKFKRLRNEVTTLIRHCKQQHTDKITQKLKSENLSSKDWWSTLKAFISPHTHSDIPPLESNGNVYTNEIDKANLLNDHFQSQTILNEQNAILPPLPPPANHTQLNSIILTPLEVESTLQTLKVGKASGPNGLNNRILRELSSQLASPFCSLFNQSLRLGIMPASYKEANVCPVPKKGDLSVTSNYRPISLLNSESKVFEKTIFKHLYNHLQENNMLSSFQSGFIPGDSKSDYKSVNLFVSYLL